MAKQHWLTEIVSEMVGEISAIREEARKKNVLKFGEERLRSSEVRRRFRDADPAQRRDIIGSIGIDKALKLAEQFEEKP